MPVDSVMMATMKEAGRSAKSEDFTRAASLLGQIKSEIRETLQAQTSEEIESVIRKLKSRETLSGEDLRVLRWWIIGDAESYVAMENNFPEWRQEFDRLTAVIGGYQDRTLGKKDLFELQGLVADASRLAADLSYFLEMQERIEKFEQASQQIDDRKADFLMDLLAAKLGSAAL